MLKSVMGLLGGLLVAFAGWAVNVNVGSWGELFTVHYLPSLLGTIGGILLAWGTNSPLQLRK